MVTIHAVNCGIPLAKSDITLIFNSTLEGSQLVFWCNESPNDTMIASCLKDGRWSIDISDSDYSCTVEGKPCVLCLS